jgi:hypothetical protein
MRYFTLHETLGLAPAYVRTDDGLEVPNPRAGELDPINEVGISVSIPTMVGKDVLDLPARIVIAPAESLPDKVRARVIPGTRIIETDNDRVATALLGCDQYAETDPPKAETTRTKREKTED